jgi:beta-galactosidase
VLIGPRSGSKTADFQIPDGLAPGNLRGVLPLTVTRVESLRDGVAEAGGGWAIHRWLEDVASDLAPEDVLDDGRGVVFRHGHARYCAGWPDGALLGALIERMAQDAGLALFALREGLGLRRTQSHVFAFNYAAAPASAAALGLGKPVIGTSTIPPAGVAVWTRA